MSTHTDILLAGAFAAFTVDLAIFPIDTLKTRFQAPDYKKIYYHASTAKINRRLLFGGLYQGVGSVILVTLPASGAFFTTYEFLKDNLSRVDSDLSGSSTPLIPQPFIHSAASATAELVSCFILAPAEVLKQNAQLIRKPSGSSSSHGTQSSATMQALRRFKSNPRNLWRGYFALVSRNLPFTTVQFPLFEHLKETLKAHRKSKGLYNGSLFENGLITAVSAGSAGSLAAWITTPMDVIKTRIMLAAAGESSKTRAAEKIERASGLGQTFDNVAGQKRTPRKSALVVSRQIIKESGIKGLFRGAILRAAWTALGSGVYLGVYESGRGWLGARDGDHDCD